MSDRRQPVPRSIRTHITEREFAALQAEASYRSITLSRLLRTLVRAHIANTRAELPQPLVNGAALRELNRIGNNLNQLLKQSHTGIVPVTATEVQRALASVLDAVRRI